MQVKKICATAVAVMVLLLASFCEAAAETPAPPPTEEVSRQVVVTAVGDCTLGTDINFGYESTLPAVLDSQGGDPAYVFRNVYPVTSTDNLTIANLEGTFTTSGSRYPKTFAFKGPPEYAKILTAGSVEAVNVANNHIYDYHDPGFQDTVKTLDNYGVAWFGEGTARVVSANGVNIGLLGYAFQVDSAQLAADIAALKQSAKLVIVSFHWGEELSYWPEYEQKRLAHLAIDNGADLVLGHHPHVLQGLEIYNKRLIAYSLGNFAFGGNMNPRDKRTMLLQAKFSIDNQGLTALEASVIPARISSVTWINDYQPTLLTGPDREHFLAWYQELCPGVSLQDGKVTVL